MTSKAKASTETTSTQSAPVKTYREAINEALRQEMRADPTVIIMGEEVSGGAGTPGQDDAYGGVFGVTKGLMPEFGRERVIDTPITESAIIGAAAGAANTGLRPVAELMFFDFIGVCFDQIFNQAAKFRYMFGGKARTPMVIRATVGAGMSAGAQHSNMLHPVVAHIPGLKVVMPSNAYDAKGLMLSAIRDDDPVIFLEHKTLYDTKCEVPDEPYTIPFGEASFNREGSDITIVALSAMVPRANAVADKLAREGIAADVIDPRTISPLDEEAILESVEMSGRLVIVDEANPRCSLAADIASIAVEKAFSALRAPIRKVTAPHTPVPFSPVLEQLYMPSEERIEQAVRELLEA
jgi:pyruvate dehydrogenase E1 component beta subunit